MNNSKDRFELNKISLEDIERFLIENNWEAKDHPNKKIRLFLSPKDNEGNRLEVLLPQSRELQDYIRRINDTFTIMSLASDTDINSLIQKITLISHDIIKVSIQDVGPSGTIPLSVAANDVNALKNLFIYAASSEEKSLPFFDKPLTVGIYHADMCQFGHTFEGSFGFTINSPIIANYIQLKLFQEKEEVPFERRVMERIIRGLDLVERSVNQNNADILVENFDIGLNARMCEALLELSQEKAKEINFHVSWSPKIMVPEDIRSKQFWQLGKQSYEVLEYAADELKKIEPFRETIVGQIVTLHSTKNPMSDEAFNRQAIVKYDYDGKPIYVKLDLERNQYRIAYEAHGKGQLIRVTGQLFRKGNTWKMTDIEEITLAIR